MKAAMIAVSFLCIATAALADSPDSSFLKRAAEGGMSEVELGQLAQQKASNPAVQGFGAMMVRDHTAADAKLKALAASEQVSLPEGPSLVQKEAFASAPSTTIKADRVHRDLSRHQRVTTRGIVETCCPLWSMDYD